MTLTITIEMDNAAFGDNARERSQEIQSVLLGYVRKIEGWGRLDATLADTNGNTVGEAKVTG